MVKVIREGTFGYAKEHAAGRFPLLKQLALPRQIRHVLSRSESEAQSPCPPASASVPRGPATLRVADFPIALPYPQPLFDSGRSPTDSRSPDFPGIPTADQ